MIEDGGDTVVVRRARPALGGDRGRSRGARASARGDRVAVTLPQGALCLATHLADPAARRRQRADRVRVRQRGAPLPGADSGARCTSTRPRRRHALSAAAPFAGAEQMHRDEPAFIFYTSGTTGTPKGAVLPQRVVHGHLPGFRTVFDEAPKPGDVFWTPSEWTWIAALGEVVLPVAYQGYPVVATSGRFGVEMAYRVLAEHGVTCPFLAPAVLRRMRAEPPADPGAFRLPRDHDRRRGARAGDPRVRRDDVRLRAERHLRPDRGEPPRGGLRGPLPHAAGRDRARRPRAPDRDPRCATGPSCRPARAARSRSPRTTRS